MENSHSPISAADEQSESFKYAQEIYMFLLFLNSLNEHDELRYSDNKVSNFLTVTSLFYDIDVPIEVVSEFVYSDVCGTPEHLIDCLDKIILSAPKSETDTNEVCILKKIQRQIYLEDLRRRNILTATDEISSELQKAKKRMVEVAKQTLDLNQKNEEMQRKIDSSSIDSILILSVFVAVITVLTTGVQYASTTAQWFFDPACKNGWRPFSGIVAIITVVGAFLAFLYWFTVALINKKVPRD